MIFMQNIQWFFIITNYNNRRKKKEAYDFMENKNVNIWKSLQKVPAGTMFVPLIIGAIITTVTQGFFGFNLWETLGNPAKDMFSSTGQMLLIGLMLFCTGTNLKTSDLKQAMGSGFVLIVTRLVCAYALCGLFYALFGFDGIFGISFLAFTCAVTSANAALYMGIISGFGTNSDKASFSIMLICSMPLLPLLFLGFFGESGFGITQIMQIVSLLIPFVLGFILGNLDEDIKNVFAKGNAIILPFLGFEFGSTINLVNAVKMIPQGIVLSLLFFIITIIPSYLVERHVLKKPGYVSFASSSLAGVALAIPAIAASSNTLLTPYVEPAVATLSFVLAITNIASPFMVKWQMKKHPIANVK